MVAKKVLEKEKLKMLYLKNNVSVLEIARMFDCSDVTVRKYLKQYDLYYDRTKQSVKRDEYGRFIKEGQTLPPQEKEKHPRWVNGKRTYIKIAKKHHAQRCFHCHKTENLQVHHMDRNRNNNHFSNLRFVCPHCHLTIEHADRLHKRDSKGRFVK